ncbi:MAG: acetate kinase [Clostridiales bacterium]|jgi:acetate kinase|nr:acetate kinase [Clostridiales bacterium]
MKILVVNCGSSSLKYQLIDMEGERVLAKGLCERIGIDGRLKHSGKAEYTADAEMKNHTDAIRLVLDALLNKDHGVLNSIGEVNAVGHRVVHGGEYFSQSVIVTGEVKKAIEECCALAPLHNPPNLIGINACEELMPGVPQAVVFDTAFHQTMPPKAYLYAIPYELYEKRKIRKYGFHGTSHKYVAQRAAAMLGKPLESLKIITCHLGNGASVCAVEYGKSIDTSMGLTPLEGLAMGTRSGSLDPAIIPFLVEKERISVKDVENILNKKSGVLGLSGVSSDFRDIEDAKKQGNSRAVIALDLFHYRVAKTVGEYAAAMNGADAVVFTAGLGENSMSSRAEVCSYLGYLGLRADSQKNNTRGKEADFATDDSKVRALVIPTNEELMIARDTAGLLAGR